MAVAQERASFVSGRLRELLADREGTGVFAGGAWRRSAATSETVCPATGERLASMAAGDAADVAAVVSAGREAAESWRATPALERSRLIRRVAEAVRARSEDLATLDALDGGNPIGACRFDVNAAAETLDYMAGLALEVKGESIPTSRGALDVTVREPFGVVARITAFNHPALFASKALGAPLVAGNVAVVKPSPWTPLSASLLVEIAGAILPPGVVGLVTGGADVALALARHPEVRRISLTGSVEAGLAVTRAAAEVAVKAISLELGGKNPLIALPDAEPDEVAAAVVDGMNLTSSAGQSCGSTSRLLVHRSLHARVVEAVAGRMAALRLGHPLDPDTEMGPLVSEAQLERTQQYVRGAIAAGARLVCGGRRAEDGDLAAGTFYLPTLFDEVAPDSALAQEEVFGPVLSVQTWEHPDEAVALANGTRYGLTASIFTNDLAAALTLTRQLRAGYIWVNGVSHHQLGAPFGGMHDSGTGREDWLGELHSYTQLKNLNLDLPASARPRQ